MNYIEYNPDSQISIIPQLDAPIVQKFKMFLLKFSSRHTRESYERSFNNFTNYWESVNRPVLDIDEIKRTHLDIWARVLEAKYPPASVAAKLAPILSFLRFCFDNDWIQYNVGDKVYLPKINRAKGKTEAFSEAELKTILTKLKVDFDVAHEPYINSAHAKSWLRYVIFLTMTSVGMRVSEIVNLKIQDFDATGLFPRLKMILKGGEEHSPLIPDELCELLKLYCLRFRNWAKKDEPLFVLSPKSKKILNREYISKMMANIAQRCGVTKRVSSHTCRATVASLLHKNSVPIGEIKELLGHKSMLTTMMYIRKTDEAHESAARKNPIFKMMESVAI